MLFDTEMSELTSDVPVNEPISLPKKRGRKKKQITSQDQAMMFEMASNGATDKQIYEAIGMSHNCFYQRLDEKNELKELLISARKVPGEALSGKMFELGMDGNVNAAKLWFMRNEKDFNRRDVNVSGEITHTIYEEKLALIDTLNAIDGEAVEVPEPLQIEDRSRDG